MSRRRIVALALGALAPLPARAALSPCSLAIGSAVEKYVKAKAKAIGTCEDERSSGKLAPAVNCRPADGPVTDAATASKLAKAAQAAAKTIGAKCTGPLPPLGPACDSAADAAALAACVTAPVQDADVEPINADTLIATIYDTTAPVTDAGLRKCQSAISKRVQAYVGTRMKNARKCATLAGRGRVAACPDASTAAATEKARAKLEKGIRAACSETQLAADAAPKLDFGVPCEKYKLTTYRRSTDVAHPNDNTIPVLDRFLGCITDAAGGVADRMADIGLPGPAPAAFPFGVAAGDATDATAIFWTRPADGATPLALDVSADATFATGVQTLAGLVPDPARDGTVKADVGLLLPATRYFYRFRQGAATSPVGSVKTAPSPSDATTVVRLGWTGDANAFFRPFTVLDPLRLAAPDAWFFIGDTIYGDDPRADGLDATAQAEYFAKYRENREDAPLRNLIGSTGTYVQWDDHEVRNDFSGAVPAFATRMQRGNLAFRAWNPIREDGTDPMRLYRSFRWGSAAEFFLLDLRQYRSAKYTCCSDGVSSGFVTTDDDTTCPGGSSGEAVLPTPDCVTAMSDPSRTVLGAEQLQWLEHALQDSTATFKLIMNGPPITSLLFQPYDRWDAYPSERAKLLDFIQTNGIRNVIWLSTDLHGIVVSGERVDATHTTPEVVAGAIGMDPIFRELPPSVAGLLGALPTLLTQITEYDIDRFNAVLLTVDPTAAPAPTARLDFYDRSGTVIHSLGFTATP
ncbi:MAG TPA: alkaline phosphatase D family protein [Candidatus Binatia bacterium]|nr:alkaline phosphatase D family protein [Candidatus Binatia bacterium]